MYVCRRMKLCGFLLRKGFRYVRVIPDKYNPKFNCWLFKSTPELKIAIEEYYEGKTVQPTLSLLQKGIM